VLVVSAPDSPAAAAFLAAAVAWRLPLLLAFLMVWCPICVVVVLSLLESVSWETCLVAVARSKMFDIWFVVAPLRVMLTPPPNLMVAVGTVSSDPVARFCWYQERHGAGWPEDHPSTITSMLSISHNHTVG
jgi:hypothetical protein